jgi:hypothetical protein
MRLRRDVNELFQRAFVTKGTAVAHIRRLRQFDAGMDFEVGTKPEAELAPLATLPLAILFRTQSVLHTIVPVSAVVERRSRRPCPFHACVPVDFPRNRASVPSEPFCNLVQGIIAVKHPLDGFSFVQYKMFVICHDCLRSRGVAA